MNSTLLDLGINIAASAIWLIVGAVITSLYFYLVKKKPKKKIWEYEDKQPHVYLSVTSLNPQKAAEYKRPTTGIGELEAVSFVRESLIAGYGEKIIIELIFSHNFPATSLTENVIAVGGKKYNQTTKLFTKDLNLPYDFDYDPVTVAVDRETKNTYVPVIEKNQILADFGVITKMPNPLNPQKHVFLLRGAHTYGVAGAGRLLTPQYSSKLTKAIKESRAEYWQALVYSKVYGSQVFPELIGFTKLTSIDFDQSAKE